jgi:5-methylcytosine-specific restriction enzyme subunit McrC
VKNARLPHLTALEHEALPITSDGSAETLSEAEAEVLLRVADTRRGFCERRYRSVRLAQHCGVVNLGQRVLEVLPKVGPGDDAASGRGVLLRLLRASRIHEAFEILPAAQRLERYPLLEVFIGAFMDAVTEIIRGGLLRQYAEREEDLRVVRGRIVTGRQFGVHFNRSELVAVRYDEHTADNRWNRHVKAALRVCRRWIVSSDLYRRWIELISAFEDVADAVPTLAELDRLVFDRQATRYRRAMDWVRWILALLSPAMRAGDARAPSFLFDMNRVFEFAVGNVLQRRLRAEPPGFEVHSPTAGRHLGRLESGAGRAVYGLRPDFVVRRGQSVHMIADTKWKRIEVTRSGYLKPSRADVYQMHAYASAFGVNRLVLIYPAHTAIEQARQTDFALPPRGTERPILSVACIDVHRDDLPVVAGAEALLAQRVTA